jgi:four helix bundle protein
MHNFKELKVWQASMQLSNAVFSITRSFPVQERYILVSQMMRCAISIPSNIAEGCGRRSTKETSHFLSIALGSSFELETQIILSKNFNFIDNNTFDSIIDQISQVQRMLNGLQKSLASKALDT